MNTTLAQLCLAASMLMAVVLTVQIARMVYMLSRVPAEDRGAFGWSPRGFLRWSLLPVSSAIFAIA